MNRPQSSSSSRLRRSAQPPPPPQPTGPVEPTPEQIAERRKQHEQAQRVARKYIIPALIAIPVLLFFVFYSQYGMGKPRRGTVAKPAAARRTKPSRKGPKRATATPAASDPAGSDEYLKAAANAAFAAKVGAAEAEAAAGDSEPVIADDASTDTVVTESKMDNKQTEELAKLLMEQLAKFAGGNSDIKFSFNDEQIKVGGQKEGGEAAAAEPLAAAAAAAGEEEEADLE
ncbi:hypothetical protein BC828DRAFT_395428 [Blastocladiella britannica]|nr:hypothetical protein BC828DRAFT_395428 [Blastocladiella britannica]